MTTSSELLAVHDGLAVYVAGSGMRTILLVPTPHACTLAPEIDKPLARLLLEVGFRVVSFDPPGAFRSTRPPVVSMAEMIGCCREALAVSRTPAPVYVAGHSMASVCAIGFALETRMASRLLLVGATTGPGAALRYGGMPRCWRPWSAEFWAFNIRGARIALGIGNLAVQKKLCAQTARASFVDPGLAPAVDLRADDRRQPASRRSNWATRIRATDYEPRLTELRLPVLVCAGRHDPQTTLQANRRVADGIAGARLVEFERSGHYPFIEERDAFARTVRDL